MKEKCCICVSNCSTMRNKEKKEEGRKGRKGFQNKNKTEYFDFKTC